MGVILLVLVLLVVGLEWNRRRQPYPRETRAGRTGVQDRDLERVRAELRAAADRES
ncbi:hypothetical protein [Kribbella catacumbae]|uniref:hypothetical protein n=1 Tax=Kribbella catacumbae TaxID=460086 RepID=UPI00037122EF|nr:hypothetical protein [Kribbella catacumbae]